MISLLDGDLKTLAITIVDDIEAMGEAEDAETMDLHFRSNANRREESEVAVRSCVARTANRSEGHVDEIALLDASCRNKLDGRICGASK